MLKQIYCDIYLFVKPPLFLYCMCIDLLNSIGIKVFILTTANHISFVFTLSKMLDGVFNFFFLLKILHFGISNFLIFMFFEGCSKYSCGRIKSNFFIYIYIKNSNCLSNALSEYNLVFYFIIYDKFVPVTRLR